MCTAASFGRAAKHNNMQPDCCHEVEFRGQIPLGDIGIYDLDDLNDFHTVDGITECVLRELPTFHIEKIYPRSVDTEPGQDERIRVQTWKTNRPYDDMEHEVVVEFGPNARLTPDGPTVTQLRKDKGLNAALTTWLHTPEAEEIFKYADCFEDLTADGTACFEYKQ